MKVDENPLDPQTEYVIRDDRPGEPDHIDCRWCDVSVNLTRTPTLGIFSVRHADWCPNAGETPPDPEVPERLHD